MSSSHNTVRRLVALSEIRGAVDMLERLLDETADADAFAVVGDLGAPSSKPDTYRAIFRALGEAQKPTFWVPGRYDAPLREYLSESANMEIVFPLMHGVHGTVTLAPGHFLVAGMGGEIVDEPDAIRDEEALLRYPAWEVEYRLKVIREFDQDQRIFLFWTQPAHKGLGEPGSEALAELVKTYRARLVVTAGEEPAHERLGTTLVVRPGRLDRGRYAIVDLRSMEVEANSIGAQASV